MKELKLGIMNNKELAEWFGIKLSTLTNTKKSKEKRLNELKNFADFVILNSKEIEIKEIYEPVYVKNGERINQEITKRMKEDIRNGQPFTCSQLGNKYFYLLSKSYGGTENTYVYRTKEVRDKLWGKPQREGNCRKTIAKLYKGTTPKLNRYELLTPLEQEYKEELFKEKFGKTFLCASDLLIELKSSINVNKTVKELLIELNIRDDIYKQYMIELAEKFNCDWVVIATIVDDTSILISEEDFNKIKSWNWIEN